MERRWSGKQGLVDPAKEFGVYYLGSYWKPLCGIGTGSALPFKKISICCVENGLIRVKGGSLEATEIVQVDWIRMMAVKTEVIDFKIHSDSRLNRVC